MRWRSIRPPSVRRWVDSRLFSYPSLSAGIVDALRLARAMSFKNASAGLDLGGGKAILIDDGRWDACREERMRSVGLAVDRLEGRYITAEDVGTTPGDMDAISGVTAHVAGRSMECGGRGDPSPYTARTVLGAIESAMRLRIGANGLDGIRVGGTGGRSRRRAACSVVAGRGRRRLSHRYRCRSGPRRRRSLRSDRSTSRWILGGRVRCLRALRAGWCDRRSAARWAPCSRHRRCREQSALGSQDCGQAQG